MKKLLVFVLLLSKPVGAVDIILTVDDTIAVRALNAYDAFFGYQATIQDPNNPAATIPNPVTKIQFFKQSLLNYVKGVVISQEAKQAAADAQTQTALQSQQQILISIR